MFLKQITIEKALELVVKGHEVPVLVPHSTEPEWTDYEPATLNEMLKGVLFFRREPAMDKEELPSPPSEKKSAAGAKKKALDMGKVVALRNAGWSLKKIADEMGVSEGTIWNNLKKMEDQDAGIEERTDEGRCDTNMPEL